METLFRSCDDFPFATPTTVTGQFPDWLQGSWYNIGPGKWDLGEITLNHFIDGYALLVKFSIRRGKVEVMSRFLNSDAYRKMTVAKRPVYPEFGTRGFPDPRKNVLSRYISHLVHPDFSDNTNCKMFLLDEELYCANDTNIVWKIDPLNLETKEKVNLRNLLSVIAACSEPRQSPDGTIYNIGMSLTTGLKYNIIKIPPICKEDRKDEVRKGYERASTSYTVSSPLGTHCSCFSSFGLSEHFFLFVEQSLQVNVVKTALSRIRGYSIKECLEWNPNKKLRFRIIEKVSEQELKTNFQSSPLFVPLHINTYEEDGHLVADVKTFEDAKILDDLKLKRLLMGDCLTDCLPRVARFAFPLNTEGVVGENLVKLKYTKATAVKQENGVIFLNPEYITEKGLDLPTFNHRFSTRKYRYIYGTSLFYSGRYRNSVLKQDLFTGKCTVWKEMDTMFASEPIFVPRPDSVEENDGVLLTVILDARVDSPNFLLLLDAKTMLELGRATIPIHFHMPVTIYGCFKSD